MRKLGPMLRDVFSQTLGIDVDVHDLNWDDYLSGLNKGEYPMFTTTSWAAYPDPQAILTPLPYRLAR